MESGLRTPDTPGESGGLIVMVRPDPADAARAIADDLHADLAIGGEETERALARIESRQLEHRDLDGLARSMRRAEAIRDRTRDRARAGLAQRLNTTVAIHPDTIRRAAAEVLAAEDALHAAVARERRRAVRARRLPIAGAAGSAALAVALGVAVAPALGVVVAVAGLTGAAMARRRAQHAPVSAHTSLISHCHLCRVRWEQVAGVGADPAQVDTIIRRYDPQDQLVASLVAEHPAVRAADRLALQRRMAWVTAWRHEVGDATPIADPALRELLQRDRTELWLTDATDLAADGATLVVAAPYADLPEARARELHRRLLGLPRGQRVIVVLAPDPSTPTGVRVPGGGWVPIEA